MKKEIISYDLRLLCGCDFCAAKKLSVTRFESINKPIQACVLASARVGCFYVDISDAKTFTNRKETNINLSNDTYSVVSLLFGRKVKKRSLNYVPPIIGCIV